MRNGSLRSDVVFEKEVIFHEFDFETSSLELEVSKSSIKKHTTLCDKGVFLSLLSRNFDDQLSSNFHRFVILCICWDTQSEKTGLWQLPKVSNVFKQKYKLVFTHIYLVYNLLRLDNINIRIVLIDPVAGSHYSCINVPSSW